MYEINSDIQSGPGIVPTVNLFNLDTPAIPREAKAHAIDDKNAYINYVTTSEVQASRVVINDVYGIDIDKNGNEDVVILSECTDKDEVPGRQLTIVMNITSNPAIIKAGTEPFKLSLDEFNDIYDVSFIDYDDKQPVLLSVGEGVHATGYAGRVLYYYEKGQFKPLFSDFSYMN